LVGKTPKLQLEGILFFQNSCTAPNEATQWEIAKKKSDVPMQL